MQSNETVKAPPGAEAREREAAGRADVALVAGAGGVPWCLGDDGALLEVEDRQVAAAALRAVEDEQEVARDGEARTVPPLEAHVEAPVRAEALGAEGPKRSGGGAAGWPSVLVRSARRASMAQPARGQATSPESSAATVAPATSSTQETARSPRARDHRAAEIQRAESERTWTGAPAKVSGGPRRLAAAVEGHRPGVPALRAPVARPAEPRHQRARARLGDAHVAGVGGDGARTARTSPWAASVVKTRWLRQSGLEGEVGSPASPAFARDDGARPSTRGALAHHADRAALAHEEGGGDGDGAAPVVPSEFWPR